MSHNMDPHLINVQRGFVDFLRSNFDDTECGGGMIIIM